MRCENSKRLISDGLDESGQGAKQARLEAHLASCPDCRAYLATLKTLQTASQAFAPADPDPDRMARSLARLKISLKEAAAHPVEALSSARMPWAWRPKMIWTGAAAALLVTAASLYLAVFRPGPAVELVPYAFSEARSGLALSLADDEALALAFDSAIQASLDDKNVAFPTAIEPLAADTGRYLDSLSDEDVVILEAAIQEWIVL